MILAWLINWGWLVINASAQAIFVRLLGAEAYWERSDLPDIIACVSGCAVLLLCVCWWGWWRRQA